MSNLVSYELDGTTAVVGMDDGKANALSHAMIDALMESLDRAEKEASAVVLKGRPERFCAGFDLKVMMAGFEAARGLLGRGSDLLMRLYGLPIPLVIACTGHALAGGALVVLTGDTRIAAKGDYKIGLNEVQIGLPVPILAMELARDRLTSAALGRATLFAEIFNPETALVAGYIDRATAPDQVLSEAKAEAARLGQLSKMAFSATKERLRGPTIAHIKSSLDEDVRKLLGG